MNNTARLSQLHSLLLTEVLDLRNVYTINRLHQHVCQPQFGEASAGGMITGETTFVVLK